MGRFDEEDKFVCCIFCSGRNLCINSSHFTKMENSTPRPDLNSHRSFRTGNPELWNWLLKNKLDDPIVSCLNRTEAPRQSIQAWIDREKKLQCSGKVPIRPLEEKSDWLWMKGMSMKCDFCDLFCTKDAMAKIPHEHGHYSFRPWDTETYTTACPICYQQVRTQTDFS